MSEVECDEFNEKYPYVVNHSTKQYINKNLMPEIHDWGVKVHPLPLLCCEGNGRGGGDYRVETEPDFVLIGTTSTLVCGLVPLRRSPTRISTG